jgi:hypothetical protein
VVLVEKHEGKRPLGRPRRALKDNIKTDLIEIEWEVTDFINPYPANVENRVSS